MHPDFAMTDRPSGVRKASAGRALAIPIFWMASVASAAVQMPLPSHNGNFTGSTRGYWFVAPNNFVITGVQVPTVAGAAAQSIAVLRFAAAPAIFPQTSTGFETLYLTQANANDGVLPTLIPITGSDIIGVLGARANVNSYGNGNFDTSINGGSVTLTRIGIQAQLETTAPVNVWAETSGSISRVELHYEGGHLISGLASPPEAGSVACTPQIVPTNATSNCTVSTNPGWTFQSVSGCSGAPSTSSTYMTGSVGNHCAVTATFAFIGFDLFDDGFESGNQPDSDASALAD